MKCGQIAAQSVYTLLRENDSDLLREARTILAEMGETAFPYIYQLAHDPQHHAHAQDIFQRIPVETISKGLLTCFASNNRQKEEMALSMLALAMDDENGARPRSSSLASALLAQTPAYSQSDACLRTLAALTSLADRMSLLTAVKELKHSAHQIAAIGQQSRSIRPAASARGVR